MAFAQYARSVLTHVDCRRYLAMRFMVMMSTQMMGVAIGWQVWDLTHSAFMLGMAGLSEFVPNMIFALPGGQIADRMERKRILLACIGLLCVSAVALAVISATPSPSVYAIFGVSCMTGIARAFFAPSSQSLLPLLVPAENFSGAVALSSTSMKVAMIVGPLAGGVLNTVDTGVVYGVAAVLLSLGAWVISGLGTKLVAHSNVEPGLKGLLAGIHYVRSRPDILGSISLDLFAVLLGGCTALLPVFAQDILHVGSTGLGALRAAPGIGSALMAVALSLWPLDRHVGPKLFVSVALFGLSTVVFGLSQSFLLSMAALLVLGAADMISVVIRQTLVQIRTPNEMRGRVSAINWIFIGASNELGEFESGLTAAWFGTVPAVVLGGVGTLVVAAVWLWAFPDLRNADQMHKPNS